MEVTEGFRELSRCPGHGGSDSPGVEQDETSIHTKCMSIHCLLRGLRQSLGAEEIKGGVTCTTCPFQD